MNKSGKHLWLGLFYLQCFLCNAQTFNFRNYNTEQGLPQSQVLSIFQDHRGYMWFGTNSGGVAKFDGINFFLFNTNNGLIDNNVFSIAENNYNKILFGTSKGLSVFNGISFKNYGPGEGLKNPLIYCLIKDGDKVWIGSQQGVYIYENDKLSPFLNDSLLSKSSVYSIYKDRSGKIWFGTIQGGIFSYDHKNSAIKHYRTSEQSDNNVVFSITQLGNDAILASCQKGLIKINPGGLITPVNEIPGSENISFTVLLPFKENELYYGTQNEGLKLFSFDSNKRLASYTRNNGLTNSQIQCLYKDNEGNLWIGTDGAGVYKYSTDKFVYYNKISGFTENYVTTVNIDSENNIWAGLKNSGLVKITNNRLETFKFDLKKQNGLPDNNITSMLPLDKGKMLFGTADGLCLYENEKFKTITENNFRHQYIFSLYRDLKNVIWIGTNDGLFKMTDNIPVEVNEIKQYKKPGFEFPIYFITEDRNGKIWVGSNSNLYSISDGGVTKYSSELNNTGYIYSGVVDHMNNLWLGTESGLFMFKANNFISMAKANNYSSPLVNFLQLDKEKKLYVGSNNGIDIIDIKSFYKNGFRFKHLGKDDGLLSMESNFNASAINKEGKIFAGTINGLEIYDPALDKINEKEPRVNILDVKLFYGEQNVYEFSNGIDSLTLLPLNLELPFSKNNLTFRYVGICLLAPEKVVYQFKLAGIDNEWSPPVYKTEITYPSLPAGTYTFMVQAMNNDGVRNKTPAEFIFTILAPWYNTWWFYSSCTFLLIGSVIFYNYYRTGKLKADKLRLENVVNIRTKELRDEKEKVESINKEVIEQKLDIENKNIEITDSIKYAKNIQEALLPSLNETENAFNNCFILYQPKDIVSGDFFWHAKKNNLQYIAAADCTGHGVPGAFMSIVGNTLLNEIVNEKNISKPGDILLELHKSVKSALTTNHPDSERRDGMDIALCCLNKNSNVIEYSGANRPLWIYRKNNNYELEIIKPTKHPIGGLETEETRYYQNNSVEIFEGDCLYIFSDGFADQFGGSNGKKFMLSNMKKLISGNIYLSMPEQKVKIKEAFNSWKKELEQVDDVLVIGIKA